MHDSTDRSGRLTLGRGIDPVGGKTAQDRISVRFSEGRWRPFVAVTELVGGKWHLPIRIESAAARGQPPKKPL